MTKREEEGRSGAAAQRSGSDDEGAVQEELRREAAERAALGGDTATNRNLSGSSTWITLGGPDGVPAREPPAGESSESDSSEPEK